MRFYLLRHAKAEPFSSTSRDFDRPLAARGHDQCAWLNHQFTEGNLPPPATVIVSPAARTQETARRVMNNLGDPEMATDERIWNGAVSDLLDVLTDHLDDPAPVMLVGHNPGFESLARWLTASVPVPGVKTCTLVDLELDGQPRPAGAKLNGLIRPGN